MKPIPVLSADLIDQLDKDEGPLRIDHKMTHQEILWRASRRELINQLKYRLNQDDITKDITGGEPNV